MARTERVGNLGYLGIAPQSNATTPVAATDFVPLYDETLTTNRNMQNLQPAYGNKFDTFDTIYGMRQHNGEVTVLAEPNTALKFFSMLLTVGAKTGAGPYDWPLTLTPNGETYYTFDISTGNVVKRFFGVLASKIAPVWNNNELQFKITVSALGSFAGRQIASVTGTGPYTVQLQTTYDSSPTTGLVAGDLIRFYKADGSGTIDATVSAVTDGTHFTTTTNPAGIASGDFVYIRPATVAFNMLPSFKWTDTEFHLADTAANALAASQTRLESGSTWELGHDFNNAAGEHRSGAQDPASLARTVGNASLTLKKFFDTPEDIKAYNSVAKSACVIRHFAYDSGNTYELRITFNQLVTDDPYPQVKPKALSYSNMKMHPSYNITDGQAFSVDVLNNLTAIS